MLSVLMLLKAKFDRNICFNQMHQPIKRLWLFAAERRYLSCCATNPTNPTTPTLAFCLSFQGKASWTFGRQGGVRDSNSKPWGVHLSAITTGYPPAHLLTIYSASATTTTIETRFDKSYKKKNFEPIKA